MGKYFKSLFFAFIFIFLIDTVNAETIQNTCSSINQACSTNNRFTYSLLGQTDDFYTGSFGSRYSGKADYLVFDFDYDLLGNSTYMLTISASDIDFRNIKKSNTFLYASTECATPGNELDITNVSYSQSRVVITFKTVSNTPRFMLVFGSDGSSTNVTGINTFGFKSVDITTVESNDTQNIIDNANQNSQAIIDNSKENTQDIIDNQNKNNEELKDTIENNFNSCTKGDLLIDFSNPYENLNIEISDITSNSVKLSNSSGWSNITYRIPVSKNSIYNFNFTLTGNSGISAVGFSSTSSFNYDLKTFSNIDTTNGYNLSFTYNNTNLDYIYISFSPYNNKNNDGITYFDIVNNSSSYESCTNKIDDLTGAITDDSPPNTDNFISNLQGLVNDGPISTLILMPFTLLNRYVEGFSGNCTPINLGNLYGTDLTMSCINVSSIVGSNLWSIIDGLISIFMIYNIAMLFVSVFNDITSLRDTFDSLYTPQHAKTLGKHTSEVA